MKNFKFMMFAITGFSVVMYADDTTQKQKDGQAYVLAYGKVKDFVKVISNLDYTIDQGVIDQADCGDFEQPVYNAQIVEATVDAAKVVVNKAQPIVKNVIEVEALVLKGAAEVLVDKIKDMVQKTGVDQKEEDTKTEQMKTPETVVNNESVDSKILEKETNVDATNRSSLGFISLGKTAELDKDGNALKDSLGNVVMKDISMDDWIKLHPLTNTQKIVGTTVFVVTLGGFMIYKYFYGSKKSSEELEETEEVDQN